MTKFMVGVLLLLTLSACVRRPTSKDGALDLRARSHQGTVQDGALD